jgi:hypothetical protein
VLHLVLESAKIKTTGGTGLRGQDHEQIKKRIYQTRAEAKSEIFDYIEVFYNRVSATSISISLVPMSLSVSVKLRYEKCVGVWGNASADQVSKLTDQRLKGLGVRVKPLTVDTAKNLHTSSTWIKRWLSNKPHTNE